MSFIRETRLSSLGQLIADMKAFPYNDTVERRKPRFSIKGRPLTPKKQSGSQTVRRVCPDNKEMQMRVKAVCAEVAGVPAESLTDRKKRRFRHLFAVVARSRGWSITLIGNCMDLHHSTVIYLLRREALVAEEKQKVLERLGGL